MVGTVGTEIENNIESIIMSLYKTLVCPGILYAVLALFLIKKGYCKSRKCAENSDRNGI